MHGLELEYYDRINFVYLDIDDPANDNFERILDFRYQPQVFILGGDGQVLCNGLVLRPVKKWWLPLRTCFPNKIFRTLNCIVSGWVEIDFCEYPEPFSFIDTRFAVAI